MAVAASVLLNRLLARARLRHVQVVVKVSELGSVKRAAQAIGMTQPAVTHVLADMETLLSVELFQRHARGMRPTTVCLDLLPRMRRMLDAMGEAAEAVAARSGLGDAFVRVLATRAAIGGLLVPALPAFSAAHPAVRLQISEVDADALGAAAARGDVDLVGCREPAVLPQGWRFVSLLADRFVVVCGPQHPLARRQRLRVAALKRETWLLAPVNSLARRALDDLLVEHGWEIRSCEVVTRDPELTCAVLSQQNAVALLPLSAGRQLVQRGQLVVLPTEDSLALAPLGLLLRNEGRNDASELFARFLAAPGAIEALNS